MLIVTAGASFIDIDAYACIVAYQELLALIGKEAIAVSTAPLNESISASLRKLPTTLIARYTPKPDDEFVLVDLSDPAYFDTIVNPERAVEIFDHHPGFEAYWHNRLGNKSHIEFIGAAATLIFEMWKQASRAGEMTNTSAQLLAAVILDNTLNFGAGVTTDRDREAYAFLVRHAGLDKDWAANYFTECQQQTMADLASALRKDTKYYRWRGLDEELSIGQVAIWEAHDLVTKDRRIFGDTLNPTRKLWLANVVSIAEGRSYFIADSPKVRVWLENLIGVHFEGDVAEADRLWLRKEILKAAQG